MHALIVSLIILLSPIIRLPRAVPSLAGGCSTGFTMFCELCVCEVALEVISLLA